MTVPETLEEALSPAWLSSVLGADVTRVTVGTVDTRVSTNVGFSVGLGDGTHRDLWVKGYFGDVGDAFREAGVPEAMFYRDVVGSTGVRTLRPVHAEVDPVTGRNVVLTEDVVGQGAVFLDALSAYSADQAAQSLEQLAVLHASTWLHPSYRDVAWLTPRFDRYTVARGVADIQGNFDGPIGALVPERVRDARRLYAAYKKVAAGAATAAPWAVIHGDPHVGNVFLDGAGRPSFVDWQLVQRGPWPLDVGYHVASSLSVEDRRRYEGDLVRHYLDCLAARGVDVQCADVWGALRTGLLHGFYLWGITLKVRPAITTELLGRLGTAVDDHDAFRAVEL